MYLTGYHLHHKIGKKGERVKEMNTGKLVVNILLFLFLQLSLYGCETERKSGKGLILPTGDIENGKASFIDLGCLECHAIAQADNPEQASDSAIMLELGGKVHRVKSYGELITSIINPNHIISPEYLKAKSFSNTEGELSTPMPDFNNDMTVTQLIDIVMFLDSHYEKLMPQYIGHPGFHGLY